MKRHHRPLPMVRTQANGESGQSLPLLLAALALGVLVISAMLYAVDARLLTSRLRAGREQDQYAADAAVEYAINRIMAADYCATPGATTVLTLPSAINDVVPTASVRCVAPGVAGGTWITQTIAAVTLDGVFFVNELEGWAVGANGVILHTTDGGLTWTAQTASPQFPPAKDENSIAFKDTNCGWSVGEGNKKSAQWTNNGGLTWGLTEKNRTGDLYAVTYDHASLGWFAGQGGEIWAIDCSGVITDRTSATVTRDLFGIDMVSGSTGWVVGDNGTIARTTNAGVTWALQTVTNTADLFAAYFPNASSGWVVGATGMIWRTINGGTNWTRQYVTATQTLRSVSFSDATTGWITGDGGVVLRSIDAGASWQPFPVPTTGNLLGVYFSDPTHGWIVGANGLLLRFVATESAGVYDILATGGAVNIAARVSASSGQATIQSWQLR